MGSQYRAHHFQASLAWLGIEEPQGNGAAERFIRTSKEQCLWARLFEDTDDLRQSAGSFMDTYNSEWRIERLRHSHSTRREVFIEPAAQVIA